MLHIMHRFTQFPWQVLSSPMMETTIGQVATGKMRRGNRSRWHLAAVAKHQATGHQTGNAAKLITDLGTGI